jgi:hypothetical protein
MNFEQFKYFLDAYGASLHRWPAERRAEAEAFIAGSSAAIAAIAEARRLDAGLESLVLLRDELRERRIVARAAEFAQDPPPKRIVLFEPLLGSLATSYWSRAAVVAAVALLGVVTGVIELQQPALDNGVPDYVQGPADVGPIELADL